MAKKIKIGVDPDDLKDLYNLCTEKLDVLA